MLKQWHKNPISYKESIKNMVLMTFDEADRPVEMHRRVLFAAPIGGQKQYSINDWFQWIANQDYEDFDICICVNGNASKELLEKLEQVEVTHKTAGLKKIIPLELKNSNELSVIQKITYSREKIRRFAVEKKYDYIFFLDTDTIPARPNTVEKLISWNVDAVSGVYFYKGTAQPVIIDRHTHTNISLEILEKSANAKELIEVWGYGFGCLLLSRFAFEKNAFDYDLFGEERTDDFGYCHVLEQSGIKRMLDADILCKHLDDPAKESMKKEGKLLHFYWQKD